MNDHKFVQIGLLKEILAKMSLIINYWGFILKKLLLIIFSGVLLSGCANENQVQETEVDVPYQVEVVAENLAVPWTMDIRRNGDIYFTERTGSIRKIVEGKLQQQPLITLSAPYTQTSEGGLLGLALDPDFENNHFLYAYATYMKEGNILNQVIRLVERNNQAEIDRILLDAIPGGQIHNGGRLKISPDRKLFITTGDSGNRDLAQDLTNLAGKILRIELDGSIPKDNPFTKSPIYSYGHRNPQGLAFGKNNQLYASEHGQSAHDEINLIEKGANYGWPLIEGDQTAANMKTPIQQSGTETWAPAGMSYISKGPWQGNLLVSSLRGVQLLAFPLNADGSGITDSKAYLKNELGRLREVIQGPDGTIYLSTSNQDGRGLPSIGDDKILKLVPKVQER